jgi:hypothetical protein
MVWRDNTISSCLHRSIPCHSPRGHRGGVRERLLRPKSLSLFLFVQRFFASLRMTFFETERARFSQRRAFDSAEVIVPSQKVTATCNRGHRTLLLFYDSAVTIFLSQSIFHESEKTTPSLETVSLNIRSRRSCPALLIQARKTVDNSRRRIWISCLYPLPEPDASHSVLHPGVS